MNRSTTTLIGLAVLAVAPLPATAQSSGLALTAHCQYHHGQQARAVMRDPSDAHSWVCMAVGRQYFISMQSACDEQYRGPVRVYLRNRNDPDSWSCVR